MHYLSQPFHVPDRDLLPSSPGSNLFSLKVNNTTVTMWCSAPALIESFTTELRNQVTRFESCARVELIIDIPCGFALRVLESLDSSDLQPVVVTFNCCVEYLADLWDLRPAVLLENPTGIQDVVDAIGHAAQGRHYKMTSRLTTVLSSTQRKVLRCVAEGLCNKAIAQRLHLQEQTVMNNMSAVLSKLNLQDRSDAIVYYWGVRHAFDITGGEVFKNTHAQAWMPISACDD